MSSFYEDTDPVFDEALDFEYVGLSDHNSLIWVRIGSMYYAYERAKESPPLPEVDKSVRGMLKYGPGKALSYLKQNTDMRFKKPVRESRAEKLISRMIRESTQK